MLSSIEHQRRQSRLKLGCRGFDLTQLHEPNNGVCVNYIDGGLYSIRVWALVIRFEAFCFCEGGRKGGERAWKSAPSS